MLLFCTMKGIILAGGTGSRLHPLTLVTNKHLLPVFNKPMVFHPLETLKKSGLTDIMIVTGGESIGDMMKLLGSGSQFGVEFTYRIQDKAGGIAHALGLCENFVGKDSCAVILGDNIFHEIFDLDLGNYGCKIFLKEVDVESAKRFGIGVISDGKIIKVVEKPKNPESNLAMTGLYVFDHEVFDVINTLKPSHRGELEITDAIDTYLKKGKLTYGMVKHGWSDAGTFHSLLRASHLIKEHEEKNSYLHTH